MQYTTPDNNHSIDKPCYMTALHTHPPPMHMCCKKTLVAPHKRACLLGGKRTHQQLIVHNFSRESFDLSLKNLAMGQALNPYNIHNETIKALPASIDDSLL